MLMRKLCPGEAKRGYCPHSRGAVEETLDLEGRHTLPSRFSASLIIYWASLVAQIVKNLPAMQEIQVHPWVGKIPWRGEWLPTPVFLPGESNGQRSLVGYSS